MTEQDPVRQQSAILAALEQLVAARTRGAGEAEKALTAAREAAQARRDARLRQAADNYQAGSAAEKSRFEKSRRELEASFQGTFQPLEAEFKKLADKVAARFAAERSAAKKSLHEARWETTTLFDATKHKPKREFVEIERQVNVRAERFEAIAADAKRYLLDCRMYREPQVNPEGSALPVAEDGTPVDDDPLALFSSRLAESDERLVELKSLGLPRFFRAGGVLAIFFGIWLVLAFPAGWLADWHLSWLATSGVATVVLGTAVSLALYWRARAQLRAVYDQLCQAIVDGELARTRWHERAKAKYLREQAEIRSRHENDLKTAAARYDEAKKVATERRASESAQIEAKYPPKLAELKRGFEAALTELTSEHERQRGELAKQRERQLQAADDELAQAQTQADERYAADWQRVGDTWRQGLRELYQRAAAFSAELDRWFPDWNADDWQGWTPPTRVAPAVRIGNFHVALEQIPGGVPDDPRLAADVPPSFELPALLSFPDRGSLVLKVGGASARAEGIDLLQAAMLRYLCAIPPGKVRFTIIDPVGLGQNFAGFMHLADYDELLVSHKIWTEPQQIEQRLADLTAHMANVIQKYLRNEFDTISDYNEHAGEVAEPFRILVVANFPFNFTEAAMRYLLSIASTGARCGVYTLVSVDTRLSLPQGFKIADLEQHGIKLVRRDEGFVWREEKFERFKLSVDTPPVAERFSRIVHLSGEGAKNASRVEVPFDFIAPPPEDWWTGSTSQGVDVPLGRAGATKRQHLKLGRGTAQHVLIAGKTGSGKSTLLHALITNLALIYHPDEVELYLIDFKKGVEFKTYAQHELPHARVIAIESEREFGLSVLQRLDAELKLRGDRFRDLNVQDLNAFRQAAPSERMPRILFIVDEFQEFFVEDDKIAQDTSLLLDRLVRQGRAFGIHVHLGSQTLGGAYGLARSTLGQMAVRIALQCSEADANLILSEENSAARLLSRPGEAIYNDANGRVEGNNLFQVVWLSDDRHEDYLRRIHALAVERQVSVAPQIVFEGNIPADIEKNHLLGQWLSSPSWPSSAPAPQAWLGDAIAIKDPTAAIFRRQSGSNMILLGQQSEGALAMMVVAVLSLAAQHSPAAKGAGARFYVLDATTPDHPRSGTLARLAQTVPHPFVAGGPRDTGRIIDELAIELARRQGEDTADAPSLYLFIYDLPRFRDLRKSEDDYGFSRGEEKPSPAKQLVSLLREGPALGIHVITWCDTLNNLHRTFERQILREFENRVLFQLSVADSSSLIDSPAASKLGPHRALLFCEEQGRLEKFRPYSMPDEPWLAAAAAQLQRKNIAAAADDVESSHNTTAAS